MRVHTNRHRKHASDYGRSRRGASAVEFAIIAPLFLLLLAGIIEFGQAFRMQHSLNTAARQTARAAIIEGSNTSAITAKARNVCVATMGVASADVTVAIAINGQANGDLSQAKRQDQITVTVSIPYSKAGVGFYTNTFASSTLSSSCTAEHE